MRIKTSLLFIFFMLCCFPCLPHAKAEEAPADTVSSADELSQWLEDHSETGGSVRLDSPIEWNGYLNIHASAPITIDAGDHCIHLNNRSYFGLAGPITVEGTPLPGNALFDTEANAQLSVGADTVVTARGSGAVAVRTRWDQGLSSYSGTIEASGQDAAAIEVAEGTLSFSYARIYAQGENAACIDATDGSVDVFFSILKASGSGAASVRSGASSAVDVSNCQPEPENARFTPLDDRHTYIAAGRNQSLYHQSILDAASLPERVTLVFAATDQSPQRTLSMNWTPDVTLPHTPGQYKVTGALELPEDFLPLTGDLEPTLTVQLVDPAKPYLMPAFKLSSKGIYAISYFKTLNGLDHHEALYLSEDLGKSWRYVPSDLDNRDSFISYDHLMLQFRNYFEPDKTYLLKMEVESPEISGTSNILELHLSADGDLEVNNFDGDRDYSDRGDTTVSTTPGKPGAQPGLSAGTEDTATYSHSQIMDMVGANPDVLTFFGDGIQSSLSSQALAGLLSDESDTLTVHCTLIGDSSYRIELIKNGTESIDFSETPLRVRVNCRLRENETLDQLSFKTADGISANIVSYDENTGQLELLVTSPGIYTLSSVWTAPASAPSAPAVSQSPHAVWIILAVLLILVIAGGMLFRHRNRTA